MIRTIKFRGKDTETGEWVYGDLIKRIGYFPSIMFPYESNGKVYYSESAVKRETIGQYTGLQDKNGVEIYEGDILQETYSNKNVLVVYDAPQFCYSDNIFGYRFLNHPENFTVIGNIHDNPELLNDVTMNNKPILDACCGSKMFYFDKQDHRVLFQDIREIETTLCDGRHFEVKPDVQADFTNMPYPDDRFAMVVFDPPHLVYTGSKKECEGWQMIKYGNLGKRLAQYVGQGICRMFQSVEAGWLPHLQMERDRHQSNGNSQTNT